METSKFPAFFKEMGGTWHGDQLEGGDSKGQIASEIRPHLKTADWRNEI
jgi:hypothetical protein